LTIVQDLLPTLVELCGLKGDLSGINGTSIAKLLTGESTKLEDRICVTQFGPKCYEWEQTVVMKDKWRLLPNNRLFDISKDPSQKNNVYDQFPEIAKQLSVHYSNWFKEAKPLFDIPRYTLIGSNQATSLTLYASDWVGDYCDNRGGLISAKGKGYWDLIVERDGEYEIELRRWPEESGKTFREAYNKLKRSKKSARPIAKAQLLVADFNQSMKLKPADTVAKFSVKLKPGKTKLTANLLDKSGKILTGALYVKVTLKK
jgi:hypothetical protein